jgi:predicted glycosyltransferase
MNFLIDIGHPAHVHLFRNLYRELKDRGHEVLVTVKDIPIAWKLLDLYGIPFQALGKKSDSLLGKFADQLRFGAKIWRLCRRRRIDIAFGSSINVAHVSRISRTKSFIFDDDDSAVQPLMARFGHPYADYIVSPNVLDYERPKPHHLTYPGYHELAYLHPKRFQPDPSVLAEAGLRPGEPFFLMRFNAFKAHHDVGVSGLSIEQKRLLVQRLSQAGKVFITTERNIDEEFLPYQLKVSPEKAHSLLYYATMLIGDSQTMTSEAAVLGTPSLRCNSFAGRISYLEEEEKKYALTFAYLPTRFADLREKLEALLAMPNLKEEWAHKRDRMLKDKIDVTAFMVWLFEHYPHSVRQIKSDRAIFNQFK